MSSNRGFENSSRLLIAKKQAKKIYRNQFLNSINALFDSVNLGVFFATPLKNDWWLVFDELLRFFIMPIAAAAAIISATFAIWQAYIDGKTQSKLKAVIELVAATLVNVAVVLGLVFASPLAPFLFIAATGLKALFHFGNAIYYTWKALFNSNNPEEKKQNWKEAGRHLYIALLNAGVCIGVGLVMVALNKVYAVFGVVSAVMGVLFAVKMGWDSHKNTKRVETEMVDLDKVVETDKPSQVFKNPAEYAQTYRKALNNVLEDSDNSRTPSPDLQKLEKYYEEQSLGGQPGVSSTTATMSRIHEKFPSRPNTDRVLEEQLQRSKLLANTMQSDDSFEEEKQVDHSATATLTEEDKKKMDAVVTSMQEVVKKMDQEKSKDEYWGPLPYNNSF